MSNDHTPTEADIVRANLTRTEPDDFVERVAAAMDEPPGAQAARIEAAARQRVLVDDVGPHAVDTTGLIEFRLTFGFKVDAGVPGLPEAHRDGWLAVFAPDETAAREAAFDRLGREWSDIARHDDPDVLGWGPWPVLYPRGEIARWVITEPTVRGC